MSTCTNSRFAETQTERLLDLEQDLRAAVQQAERAPLYPPQPPTPAGRYTPRRAVLLSAEQARTILRAILPACLALGRTRRATLALHEALAGFHAALTGTTEPPLLDGAIAAALALAEELDAWITEARWRSATRKAGVSWRREGASQARERVAISPLLRQSTAAKGERAENTPHPAITDATTPAAPPRQRKKQHQAPGQVTLLLPIASEKRQDQPAPDAKTATTRRKSA